MAAGVLLAGAALYGWWRRLREVSVAELFLPLYLALILLWPAVWAGERFLLPVLGVLLAFGGDGLLRAAERVWPGRGTWAGAAAAALLFLVALPGVAARVQLGRSCSAAWSAGVRYPCMATQFQEFFAVAESAGRTLPEDAVVLSRKPSLFYITSGLQGRNYPMAATTQALLAAADSAGARWVVFDQLGGLAERYLAPAIMQRPAAFCLAAPPAPGGTVLFGIRPEAPYTPDAPPAAGDAGLSFEPCVSAARAAPPGAETPGRAP
jgi:hypothetical protein